MAPVIIPIDFIESIKTTEVIHRLYQYDHLKNSTSNYFSTGTVTAWDEKGSVPIAIAEKGTLALTLSPNGIGLLNSLTAPSLTAKLQPTDSTYVFDHKVRVPVSAPPDASAKDLEKLLLVPPTFNNAKRPTPWQIKGELHWTLQGTDPKQPAYTCITKIEIYALPSTLPAFYTPGIPVALLRDSHYLPAWMQTEATEWPVFAIQALASDPRLEHRSWNGTCRYINVYADMLKHFANNGYIDCWLDLWLTDLATIAFDERKLPVNSLDLAALAQVLVGIGGVEMSMYYMSSFGFLKPTKLLGRKPDKTDPHYPDTACNNPKYGTQSPYGGKWNATMNCGENDGSRSALEHHMFLTLKEKVFDVCCGPHVGSEDLDAYITASVDTQTTLYKDYPTRFALGGRSSVIDGVGVGYLVPSCAMSVISASSLIDRLAQRFQRDGIWSAPYITAPSGPADVAAMWTLQPNADASELITVKVLAFRDRMAIAQQYNRMRDSVLGWDDHITNMENDAVQGSVRVFYNDNEGGLNPMYLAIIESRVCKSQETLSLRNDLEAILDSSLAWTRGPVRYIDSITTSPPGAVAGGQIITVSLKKTARPKSWQGLTVRTPRSNVVFLDASLGDASLGEAGPKSAAALNSDVVNSDEANIDAPEVDQTKSGEVKINTPKRDALVNLHFLALRKGFVTVIITMFGGNLDPDVRYVNLEVK